MSRPKRGTGNGSKPGRADEPDLSVEALEEALDAAMRERVDDPEVLALYGERDDAGRWTGAIVAVYGSRSEQVALANDLAVPARVRIERGSTTVDVDATGEVPRYVVSFETRSPTVLRRLHLQALVEQSLAHVAVTTTATPPFRKLTKRQLGVARPRASSELLAAELAALERFNELHGEVIPAGTRVDAADEAKQFVRRRTSRRAIDQAAHQAAEVYPTGGIEAVRRVLFTSERQAWRYVQRAQEMGLLERQRAPRKKGSAS